MDVITQIEAAMRARGVTAAELSRRLGYRHDSAVSRLLNRKHEPGAALLEDIATALETELVIPAVAEVRIQPRSANCATGHRDGSSAIHGV